LGVETSNTDDREKQRGLFWDRVTERMDDGIKKFYKPLYKTITKEQAAAYENHKDYNLEHLSEVKYSKKYKSGLVKLAVINREINNLGGGGANVDFYDGPGAPVRKNTQFKGGYKIRPPSKSAAAAASAASASTSSAAASYSAAAAVPVSIAPSDSKSAAEDDFYEEYDEKAPLPEPLMKTSAGKKKEKRAGGAKAIPLDPPMGVLGEIFVIINIFNHHYIQSLLFLLFFIFNHYHI
jgi:hypothetical protein